MINNRQGGRRRGRGGQGGGRNLGGQPGNRQDNRQRGNAAQLLEKYKNMARDAQLAGDRVQTEYYLQYADHYFRVLSESRARFEDQRRQRGEDLDDEDDGDDEMVDAGEEQGAGEERDERRERSDRGERYSRRERGERNERRPRRNEERAAAEEGDDDRDERGNPSARMNGGDSMPFDALPPAIGRDEPEAEDTVEEEPRRPRRRARTPRAVEGDDEAAPAA